MSTIEETKKRLEIANKISSQLESIVKGVLLGGSMGYGQNFSVTEKSDIDMVVVCDKNRARNLEATPYFAGHIPQSVLRKFEEGTINLFWVTKEIDSVKVNSFIYETEGYEKFCLFKGGIKGYISTKPSGTQTQYGFDGQEITFQRNVTPYEEGYLYERPALVDGKFWSVPPRDDFTRGFYILQQEDSFFDILRNKVWDAIIKQLIKEHGPEVNLNNTSILKSDFVYQRKPEKLPPSVLEKIKRETENRLKNSHIPKET